MKSETKPLHSGEVYYLWESLTGGYRIISIIETYLMNTEDAELHLLLQMIIDTINDKRINPIEKILKGEGFSIPAQPGTKITQGKPGVGQEVKLSDDEIIRSVMTWAQFGLNNDARAVVACTNENIRQTFIDLLFSDMKSYSSFLEIGIERQVYFPPPAATARKNSLNIDEVSRLWEELGARQLTILNCETFLMNTNDKDLINLLTTVINRIALPQLKQIEDVLKAEGFTVPPRPIRRLKQGTPGEVSKIILSDMEILGELTVGGQVAIIHHVRSYTVAIRKDIRNLFNIFISTEIEEYQKLMKMASSRHSLVNPPVVTSHRG
jgi:hypothetical protein